jgi:hypothetical protein
MGFLGEGHIVPEVRVSVWPGGRTGLGDPSIIGHQTNWELRRSVPDRRCPMTISSFLQYLNTLQYLLLDLMKVCIKGKS